MNKELIKGYGFKSSHVLNHDFKHYTKRNSFTFIKKQKFTIEKTVKPTIGYFANTFSDEYGISIWEGIKKATQEFGYNLISFVGGSLNNPYFDNTARNAVFDLACNKNVDGILAASVSIGSFIDSNRLNKFLNSIYPIPFVSIGISLDNIPSIVIDNKKGMYNLMIHLIETHGYERIAFIRGPGQNRDADIRFKIYKDVLTKYNIAIDPGLIVKGSFYGSFGKLAIAELLDERRVSFDALIGSNDYVAINAIDELQKRGIRVPEDVGVVGFDDVAESRYLKQPLTTVNQPFTKIGYHAARTMFKILNGKELQVKKEIASHLVVRRSCGCSPEYEIHGANRKGVNVADKKNGKNHFVQAVAKGMNIEINDILSTVKSNGHVKYLYKLIVEILEKKSEGNFRLIFQNIINKALSDGPDIVNWDTTINLIFEHVIPELTNKKKPGLILKLFNNVSKLIYTNTIEKLQYSILKEKEYDMHLFHIKQLLYKVVDIDQLKEIVKQEFPLLGIKSCYISIFSKRGNDNFMEYSEIVVSYKNYICMEMKDEKPVFSTQELIPRGCKNNDIKDSLFVLSLNYKKELLGFVVYEIENSEILLSPFLFSKKPSLCEVLTIELGNAIKSITLFSQVKEQTKHIGKRVPELSDKYKSNYLPDESSKIFYKKLLIYMENEKPYIDMDLTLPMLAEQLNLPRNQLSYIINKYSKVHFCYFINSYRIKEAKSYLEKDCGEKINILEIVYNCGFKSKSTFYKIFKEITHLTPTEYRDAFFANSIDKCNNVENKP